MAEHLISRDLPTHRRWDVDIEPVLHVEPGDVIVAETDDFAGGQIGRDSTSEDLRALDFDTIYPLAGPIHVAGAEPGDVLAVEFLGFELPDWGWAAILPELGLLPPGELDEPYLKVFDLTQGDSTELAPGVRIPIEPFCGTTGVPGPGMRDVPIPPPHAGRRQHRPAPRDEGRDALPAGGRRREPCSRWAMRTPRRATGRCASPGSSARCGRRSASRSSGG